MWEEELTLSLSSEGVGGPLPRALLHRVWRQKFVAAVLAVPGKLKCPGNFRTLFPGMRSHRRLLAPRALTPCLARGLTSLASGRLSGGWRLTFTTGRVQAGCETTCSRPSVPRVGTDPDPGGCGLIMALDQMLQPYCPAAAPPHARNDFFTDSFPGHLPFEGTPLLCGPRISFL